jgi:hypothetical protein
MVFDQLQPFDHGVVDVINQAFLNRNDHGVRAGLYSLNVISGIPELLQLNNIRLI